MNQTRLIQPEDLSTQEIFSMENLTNSCRQLRRNNGAAGVDGVKARELPVCPGEYWEQLREQILDRSYKPLPATRTDIRMGSKPENSLCTPESTGNSCGNRYWTAAINHCQPRGPISRNRMGACGGSMSRLPEIESYSPVWQTIWIIGTTTR